MSDSFDDLSSLWKEVKNTGVSGTRRESVEDLISLGKTKQKSTLMAHIISIIVMSLTAITIAYFLGHKFPYHTNLGKFAVNLMVGVLALRIVIELISLFWSRQIRLHDTTVVSLKKSLGFLKFRKLVNGPITYTAILVYIIGFNLLLPELSIYLSAKAIILLDISAFIIVGIITYVIAKGIKREMVALDKLIDIQKTMGENL
ncbi:MAG: hypothetical protein ABIS36_03975 [Chryseolinea sp.]